MSAKFVHTPVRLLSVACVVAVLALFLFGSDVGAESRSIGRAESYAVLAGATVTNTGPSVIIGDLGVFPGTEVTGNPQVNGEIHAGDLVAGGAQTDARAAHTTLGALPCTQTLPGIVGDLTLTPGVYCFTSDALFNGVLTLDFQGNPDAEFVFKIGTALTMESGSVVALINSPNPCNVFWQVGSSATLGTNSVFVGTVIADQSITAATGADVTGRLLALVGQVSLDNNTVQRPTCAPPTTTTAPGGTTTVPGATTTVPGATTTTVPGATTTTVPGATTTTVPGATTTTVPGATTTTVPGATTTTTSVPGTTTTTTVFGATTTVPGTATTTMPGATTNLPGGTTTGSGTSGAMNETSRSLPRSGSDAPVLAQVGLLGIVLGGLLLVSSSRSIRREMVRRRHPRMW